MHQNINIKEIITKNHFGVCMLLLTALTLSLFICFTTPAMAQENNGSRTIRVGYIISSGYQEGEEGEYKTGFGYEYYQQISYYTGWKYEYVYGGFSELLDKVKTGEIDIMGNISYTEERGREMDFSQFEQGYESYYLLTLSKNKEITEDNKEAINGKKICISKGSIQYDLFIEWCKDNDIQCEIIGYEDREEREADLNSGAIDATVATRVMTDDPAYANWRSALKIGDSPYYFAVSKHCEPAVLQELNDAMNTIHEVNPHYYEDVHGKYFSGRLLTSDYWTTEEEELLEKKQYHLKIGYMDNYLPFSDKDSNGKMSGVVAAIAAMIHDEFNITMEGVAFSCYDEMKEALSNKEIDMIFPVLGDYWAAEQQGLFLSKVTVSTNIDLLYLGEYSKDKTEYIAVSEMSPFQEYYALIHFPEAKLIKYHTINETIDAVLRGKADCTFSSRRFFELNGIENKSIETLSEVEMAEPTDICFGVLAGDTALLSICDKSLQIVSNSEFSQAMVSYSYINKEFSFRDYIKEHPYIIIAISGIIILIIILIGHRYIRREKERHAELIAATKATEEAKYEKIQLEKELGNSRIRIMLSQMQPHFLYNALSAIRTITKEDPEYASDLIYDFTIHLRSSIKALNSDEPIPFTDEIKNIEAYLNIEKMRFAGLLKVDYELNCKDFKVIPLTIQPLAENAARHGIYQKADHGRITIRSYENEKSYIVEVEDDGIGFDVEKTLNQESDSIGLQNLIFRLKTLMNAEINIKSHPNEGTLVRVVIPKNDKEGES